MGGSTLDLDRYLAECRDMVRPQLEAIVESSGSRVVDLYGRMLDYPLREAKWLRPALCLATCRALGGSFQAALPTAAVLELYHNAFLIHDDIEDRSLRRRGAPTLHRMYGMPIAVNIGDAMLALSLQPLLDNMRTLGMGPALRILQEVADMARVSAEGQAIELEWIREGRWEIDDEDYVEMVAKKTARYTFVTPMVLGAVIADRPGVALEPIRRFAHDLGVAFQIQDDILNLVGDERLYGKETCGDLWEGKHTLALLHAMRLSTPAERERAATILSKPRPGQAASALDHTGFEGLLDRLHEQAALTTPGIEAIRAFARAQTSGLFAKMPEEVDFLRGLIMKAHGVEHARAVALEHTRAATETLEQLAESLTPSPSADVLGALVQFVVDRIR